jgi:hypothetical protein
VQPYVASHVSLREHWNQYLAVSSLQVAAIKRNIAEQTASLASAPTIDEYVRCVALTALC